MLKYIYVFILIIILFWIKWKLQKNNKIKEEFEVGEEFEDEDEEVRTKLTDMFSSSDVYYHTTFYDKLNRLKSNINIDVNDNIIFNKNNFTFMDATNNNNIRLHEDGNGNVSLKIKNIALYATGSRTYSIWNYDGILVSKFDRTQALTTPIQPINTSVRDLINWHTNNLEDYSMEPYNTNFANSYSGVPSKTVGECHGLCEDDPRCIGFSINNSTGYCVLTHTSISLDSTNTDYTTYLKPGNTFT